MADASVQTLSRPVVRPAGLRSVPLGTWVLLALGLLDLVVTAENEWSTAPHTLAAAGVFLFCAALVWAAPADRPVVTYGAWVIAASAVLLLIPSFLSADVVSSTPVLSGVPYWLGIASSVALTVGVVLLGTAYGVIHSHAGWTVFWIGALLTVSGIGLVTVRPAQGVGPLDVLILSAIQVVPLAWAYLCAVFLGINRWMVRGAAVLLVFIAMSQLVAWLQPGPETNFANLRFGLGLLEAICWTFLFVGALTLRPSSSKGTDSRGR